MLKFVKFDWQPLQKISFDVLDMISVTLGQKKGTYFLEKGTFELSRTQLRGHKTQQNHREFEKSCCTEQTTSEYNRNHWVILSRTSACFHTIASKYQIFSFWSILGK